MDSGLIAVCLIIRSKEGPRFVYHHPPRPTLQTYQRECLYGTELDESDREENPESADDTDDSDLEDGEYAFPQAFGKLNINNKAKLSGSRKPSHVEPMEGDDHYDTKYGEHVVPWEQLFEYSTTDLESILTPSRAFHKKKFELCLDPLHFISYPMHIREDGLWKKKKPKKAKKSKKEKDGSDVGTGSGDVKSGESEKKGDGKPTDNTSEDGDDHGGMTMFNVVFVLNMSKEQVDTKILEIYEHVVKKFNKALNHAQAQGNYVWNESEMILGVKEKAREERKFDIS
jgi:nitrogen permease regulator 3-like protein